MSLTQTARQTRKAVNAILILTVVLIVGRFAWKTGYGLYLRLNPPPEPPPQVTFGKLPALNIQALKIEGEGVVYSLDTPTGTMPSFPTSRPVFPLKKISSTPLNAQTAKNLASRLGFSGPPVIPTPNRYRWTNPLRALEINIVTSNFSLRSDLAALQESLTAGTAPAPETAILDTRTLIGQLGLSLPSPEKSRQTTELLRVESGEFRRAEGPSEAQLTRVDIFPTVTVESETYPLLGASPKEGLIWVVESLRQATSASNLPFANYQYREIQEDAGATYPLESPESVWKKFIAGQGSITSLKKQESESAAEVPLPKLKEIHVYTIYLAYYRTQNYTVPIYVFEGIASDLEGARWDYVTYLPAIQETWLEVGASLGTEETFEE